MMFRVQGAEEVGGGFVSGLVLSAAPMHEQAVAQAPEHTHDPHRLWFADPALVVQMRHIQSLVESAFDAPSGPVVTQPLGGIQLLRPKARHQGHGFGRVLAQVPAQEGDLLDAGKVHLLGCGRQ